MKRREKEVAFNFTKLSEKNLCITLKFNCTQNYIPESKCYVLLKTCNLKLKILATNLLLLYICKAMLKLIYNLLQIFLVLVRSFIYVLLNLLNFTKNTFINIFFLKVFERKLSNGVLHTTWCRFYRCCKTSFSKALKSGSAQVMTCWKIPMVRIFGSRPGSK